MLTALQQYCQPCKYKQYEKEDSPVDMALSCQLSSQYGAWKGCALVKESATAWDRYKDKLIEVC